MKAIKSEDFPVEKSGNSTETLLQPTGCSSGEDVLPNIPSMPAKRKNNRVVKNKHKRKQKSIKKVENADEKAARIRKELQLQIELLRAKKKPNFKFGCSPPVINVPNISRHPSIEHNESVVEETVLRKKCRHVLETGDSDIVIVDVIGGYQSSDREEIKAELPRDDEPQLHKCNEYQEKEISKLKICEKILKSLKSEKSEDNSIFMSTSNSSTIAPFVSTIPTFTSIPSKNFYGNSSRVILNTYDASKFSTLAVHLKPYNYKSKAEKRHILEATRLPLMYFKNKKHNEDNDDLVLKYRSQFFKKVPIDRESYNIFSDITNMYKSRRGASAKVSPNSETSIIESDDKIQQGVKSVMDKLLNYVDVLDETKYLHINYENIEKSTEEPALTVLTVRPRGRPIKRSYGPRSKISKISLELKRLNCQIVSVVNDEDNSDDEKCTKEVCKLGCICKTLRCDSKNLLPTHCGSWKCIFKCSCKTNSNMDNTSLQIGSNIINAGAINRLQDQVKKNLAKVEKEFSQTIIKTNDQLIMVENSKKRRR